MEKFKVIVADPPWSFNDKLTMSTVKRGAEANYGTLTLQQIAGLPIGNLSADNALLALWIPSSLLKDGLLVMDMWGFQQKQIYTWVKTSSKGLAFGMGRYFRNCTEHALIGTRGKVTSEILDKAQRCVSMSPNLKHSQKPELLQEALEKMLPGPYLELFARRDRPNWICVGNECPSTMGVDIRDWLKSYGV